VGAGSSNADKKLISKIPQGINRVSNGFFIGDAQREDVFHCQAISGGFQSAIRHVLKRKGAVMGLLTVGKAAYFYRVTAYFHRLRRKLAAVIHYSLGYN